MNAIRTPSLRIISLTLLGKHCELEICAHTHTTSSFCICTCICSQSLYDNEQQIQDQFAQFWATVAYHFSSNPYVLGYELLNEPWAGDIYRHPDQLEPREQTWRERVRYDFPQPADISDPKNLMPMYKKLHSAIREHDDKHIILYEPTIITTSVSCALKYEITIEIANHCFI